MRMRRTDLALEARELWQERAGAASPLPGVEAHDSLREGIPVSTVKVLDARGEEALGKPRGSYVTLTLRGWPAGRRGFSSARSGRWRGRCPPCWKISPQAAWCWWPAWGTAP